MSEQARSAASILDRVVHSAGEGSRVRARKIAPMWLKRKVSAFLSANVTTGDKVVVAKTGHTFVSLKEPVFLQVRYDGIYEKELTRVIAQFVSEGDVVADVGANFGWHSITMAERVGSTGQVFSFEPNEEMFEALSTNIDLNDFGQRVTSFNAAVGEETGVGTLNADTGQSAIGYMSLSESASTELPSIAIESLDGALESHLNEISFVKIDVEGFEPFVLRGANELLAAENPPVMMVEFSPEALERQPIKISEFLEQLHAIDAVMTLPIDGQLVEVDGPPLDVVTNLFMLPKRGRFQRSLDDINRSLRSDPD